MFIHTKNEGKRNYLMEAIGLALIVVCLGINSFSDNLGFTSKQSAESESFQGFKMVNVSRTSR